jgi:oligopeptide transport system permease protein
MLRYIFQRLIVFIPVLWVIATITFFMVRLAPGDPFSDEKEMPEEVRARIKAYYGLDQPLWKQYLIYLGVMAKEGDKHRVSFTSSEDTKEYRREDVNATLCVTAAGGVKTVQGDSQWLARLVDQNATIGVLEVEVFRRERSGLLQGHLGPSFKHKGKNVNDIIREAFPKSLELGLYAMAIALMLGIAAGSIAALKQNSILDYTPMSLAMMGICLPTFVMGPLLVLVFGLWLEWFPVAGWSAWSWEGFFPEFPDGWPGDRVLPACTLGFFYAAMVARLTRGGMLETLNQDFIKTARAKGLSETRVVVKHALRGGILPTVSFLGPAFAGIISGSFVIETIFNIPGLGRHFIEAATNRDYTLVLGTVLFYATLILALNLIVDILQAWLNPRMRIQ